MDIVAAAEGDHGGRILLKVLQAGTPPEVQQRFLKLWSHRTGALKHEAARVNTASGSFAPPATEAFGKAGAKNYALIAIAAAIIVGGAGWWLFGGRTKPATSPSVPASVEAVSSPKPAAPPASAGKARTRSSL